MKNLKIISVLAIIFTLSQCGSINFERNPPFEINSAAYFSWVGGQPGISGMNVKISYTSDKNIQFDSIYFRKRSAKLEVSNTKDQKMITGHFNTSSQKREFVMELNPVKEMKNEIPNITSFPFKLNENEAIISYKIKDKKKYFKIKTVKKGERILFIDTPKQL